MLTSSQIMLTCSQIDIGWDDKDRLSSKDKNYRCGIKDYFKIAGESRIINGRSTSNEVYPWLSQIINYIPAQGGLFDTSGTIISNRIILTCLHCVCSNIGEDFWDVNIKVSKETCLDDTSSGTQLNQNRLENQVHYFIGNNEYKKGMSLHFNLNIKAYTYKYDPGWKIANKDKFDRVGRNFFKNGDVAIVIDTSSNGLNLQQHKAMPICLPTPNSFQIENINNGLPVITAGRGHRYQEGIIDDDTGELITSCFTNEGLVAKKGVVYEGAQNKFLSCKDSFGDSFRDDLNKPQDDVCLPLSNAKVSIKDKSAVNAKNVKSISTDSMVTFFRFSSRNIAYTGHKDRLTIRPPQNDKCEDYWLLAEQSLKELKDRHGIGIIKPNDFTSKPDRIMVLNSLNFFHGKSDQYIMQYLKSNIPNVGVRCYNLQKLAQHGICETDDAKYPWGFCSPSCSKSQTIEDSRQYEKMDAKYHEKAPKFSRFRRHSTRKKP